MISCPQCSTQYPSGTTHCPKDGTALPSNISVSAPVLGPRPNRATDNPWEAEGLGSDQTTRRDSLQGLMLGEYEAQAQLGEGGMGIVYRGMQPLIGKPVAIKVLRPEFAADPKQVQRLLDEARAVNSIRHPGIVDIFSFGKAPDGRQYFVMELLDGHSLEELLRTNGKLKAYEVIGILEQAFAALDAAHGARVIHRDLKPSNIFLVDLPDHSFLVKLLDFGLAKSTSQAGASTPQTSTNLVVGTPAYMAPEQARGQDVSPRTDLYSMGVVAYELLTGRIPFEGGSAVETMMMHLDVPPQPPGELEASIPASLEALVLKLLAKVPAQRPSSAAEVRRELGRIKRELTSAQTLIADSSTGDIVLPGRRVSDTARTPAPSAAVSNARAQKMSGPIPAVAKNERSDTPRELDARKLFNTTEKEAVGDDVSTTVRDGERYVAPVKRTSVEVPALPLKDAKRWLFPVASGVALLMCGVAFVVFSLTPTEKPDFVPPPPVRDTQPIAPQDVEVPPEPEVKPPPVVVKPPPTVKPPPKPGEVTTPTRKFKHGRAELLKRIDELKAVNDAQPDARKRRINGVLLTSEREATMAPGTDYDLQWEHLDALEKKLK